MDITLIQQCSYLESDLETPVGMFMRIVGEKQGILFESANVDGRWGRYSTIAADPLLTATCRNGVLDVAVADERLQPLTRHTGKPFVQGLRDLKKSLHIQGDTSMSLPPITRALYGYLGYGVAGFFEPKLAHVLPPSEAEACMMLPGTLVVFDHGYNKIVQATHTLGDLPLTPLPSAPPQPFEQAPPAGKGRIAGKEDFTAAVARVKEQLHQGEAIQVVLSTRFNAPLTESPFNLYRRLRRINPSPYMFYMRTPGGVLLGSSPEVLVSCEAGALKLCPIAGTRPRSHDLLQDALFGDELLRDPKEKSEHVMLVDLGRNDLGRIAAAGSVVLERFMEVERFSNVMHLTSRIAAKLEEGLDSFDVLASTLPAGTVSGAPKVRAMEIIAQEEGSPRGPYAGAVGWLGLDQDAVHLDFGIVIRSLWVRDGQIHWQAGAGIVHDSDAEKEWLECLSKAEVMKRAVMGQDTNA